MQKKPENEYRNCIFFLPGILAVSEHLVAGLQDVSQDYNNHGVPGNRRRSYKECFDAFIGLMDVKFMESLDREYYVTNFGMFFIKTHRYIK